MAEKSKKDMEGAAVYPDPIVTEIVPLNNYYEAEDITHLWVFWSSK